MVQEVVLIVISIVAGGAMSHYWPERKWLALLCLGLGVWLILALASRWHIDLSGV